LTEYPKTKSQESLIGEVMLLSLLSRIIFNYPDNEERTWLQSLINEDVFSDAPFAAEKDETKEGLLLLQNWGKNGLSNEVFEHMQTDYTRMFIGPGKVTVPPWESVYFGDDKLVFQEQTLGVRNWYRRFGLEAEKLHREPDDHIGLEMSFISHLATLGIQALNEQDKNRFEEILDAKSEFFKNHLGKWALRWCFLVKENAQTDFYQGVAHLIHGAMSELSEVLDVKITKDPLL